MGSRLSRLQMMIVMCEWRLICGGNCAGADADAGVARVVFGGVGL